MVENPHPTISVLLIDGNKNDREYWAQRLRMCSPDFIVLEADDGRSGLALIKLQQVDCVVIELSLPDMSGLEILLNLVPRPKKPEMAVIILTRLVYASLPEVALNNGALGYLIKSKSS